MFDYDEIPGHTERDVKVGVNNILWIGKIKGLWSRLQSYRMKKHERIVGKK